LVIEEDWVPVGEQSPARRGNVPTVDRHTA